MPANISPYVDAQPERFFPYADVDHLKQGISVGSDGSIHTPRLVLAF